MSRPVKRKPRATLLLFDPLNSPVKPMAPRKSPLSLSVFTEEEENEEENEEEQEEATREHTDHCHKGQPSLYNQVDDSLYSIYSGPSSGSSLSSLSLPPSHSGFLVDVGSPEKQGSLVGDLIGDFDDHEVSQTRYVDENEVDSLLMSLDSPVQSKITDKSGPDRTSSMETPVRAKHVSQPSFDSPSTPSTVLRPSRSAGKVSAEPEHTKISDLVTATPTVSRITRASSPPCKSTSELSESTSSSVQLVSSFSIPQESNEPSFAPSPTTNIPFSSEPTIPPGAINPQEIPLPSSPPSEPSFFLTAPDKSFSPPRSTGHVSQDPSSCILSSDGLPKDEGSLLLETRQPSTVSRAPSPSFFFDVTDTSFDLLADATLPEGLSMSTLRAPSPMLLAPQELTEGASFIMKSPATSRSPAPKRLDGRAPSPFADSSFDLLDESLPDIPPETSFALPPPTPRSGAPTPKAKTRYTNTHGTLQGTPSQATPTMFSKIQRSQLPSFSSSSPSPSLLTPQAPSITLSVPSPVRESVQKDNLIDEGDTTLNLDDHFKNEDMSFCHLPGMSLELDEQDDRWDISFADFAASIGNKKFSDSKDLGVSFAPPRSALSTAQPDSLAAPPPLLGEIVSRDPCGVMLAHDKTQIKGNASHSSLCTSISSNSLASSTSSSRTTTLAHPPSQRSILAPTNRQVPISHQRNPSLPRETSRALSSSTKALASSAQLTPRPIRKSPSVSSTLDFQQTPRSSVPGSHGRSKSLASQSRLDSPSLVETPVRSKPLPFSRLHVRLSATASPRATRNISSEKPGSGEESEKTQSRMKSSVSTGFLAREVSDLPSSKSSSSLRSVSGPSTLNHVQSSRSSISTPSAPRRTSRPVPTPKSSLTPSDRPVPPNPPSLALRPSASGSLLPSRSIPKPSIKSAAGAPAKAHTIESIRAALANLEAKRGKH